MPTFTRREFSLLLGTGLAGLLLLDEADASLPAYLTTQATDPLLSLHTRSGTTLLFYGINLQLRNGKLLPVQAGTPSYLLVQLPSQSLHEPGIGASSAVGQVTARVAGPSFLAFELWPALRQSLQPAIARSLTCNRAELLAWDDMARFRLVAASEPALRNVWPAYSVLSTSAPGALAVQQRNPTGRFDFYDFSYYQALLQGIWQAPTDGHPPVTLLEVPAGLLMSPVQRRPELPPGRREGDELTWQAYFRTNDAQRPPAAKDNPPFRSGLGYNPPLVQRTVLEVWQAELRQGVPNAPWLTQPSREPLPQSTSEQLHQGLRLLGYLEPPTAGGAPASAPSDNLLPSPDHIRQLLLLNQLAVGAGTQGPSHDLNLTAALTLGERGASLKFRFRNYQPVGSLDLVEYEHHLQDGRDNYIKIGIIGVLAPLGLKAVFVQEARRVVQGRQSFLRLEQYVELLETSKDFARTSGALANYECFTSRDTDSQQARCYPAQVFFTRVEAAFTRTPPIRKPPEAGPAAELAFWLHRPDTAGDDFATMLRLPFRYYDANGEVIPRISEHAVQFLSRSVFVANPTGISGTVRALLHYVPPTQPAALYLGRQDDGRRLQFLGGQVLALTEDAPLAAAPGAAAQLAAVTPALPNRPNRIAVDWAECYYHVAKGPNAFDSPHPVYPQVRHVKAYLDHVQGVAGEKLPSLLEYAPDYLRLQFTGVNAHLRLMLQHTAEFRRQELRRADGEPLSPANLSLYADLRQGMGRIRAAFAGVRQQFGGLANPDPPLRYVAGHAQNIGLPDLDDLTQVQAQLAKPLAILNGGAAELLGGIKLVRILQESLDPDETPRFVQERVATSLTTLAGSLNNPAVRAAAAAVAQTQQVLAQTAATVQQLDAAVQQARESLRIAQAELLARVPDLPQLETLALATVERARLALVTQQLPSPAEARRQMGALRLELALALEPYANALLALWALPTASAATPELVSLYYLPPDWLAVYPDLLADFVQAVLEQAKKLELTGTQAAAELAAVQLQEQALRTYLVAQTTRLSAALSKLPAWPLPPGQRPPVSGQVLAELVPALLPAATHQPEEPMVAASAYLLRQYEQLGPRYLPAHPGWDRLVGLLRLVVHTRIETYRQRTAELDRQVQQLPAAVPLLAATATQQALKSLADTTSHAYQDILQQLEADPAAAYARVLALRGRYTAELQKAQQAVLSSLRQQVAGAAVRAYERANSYLQDQEAQFRRQLREYLELAQDAALNQAEQFGRAVEREVNRLSSQVEVEAALQAYEQARRLLQAPLRQELRYSWQTTGFTDVDLGLVRFIPLGRPRTTLRLHASTTLTLDAKRLPALTTKATFRTDTELTDFALSFLGVLRIDFERLRFWAGSERSPNLDVRIRGVRFEGPLTFIQALQDMLSGLVNAFVPLIQERRVTIDYQSPPFGVSTPGFTFANISFGVRVDLFFDRRPMLVTLRLAQPENKATVAAGILGGCFFFSITVSPTQGVVQVAMALEMGALMGLSLGPIRGVVRFMVGIYYRRHAQQGVLLEGYFIAEGRLKVWVISVSARLYMAVQSQNSYVVGFCIVSYRVKVGFLRRSFSARYSKTLAGANRRRQPPRNTSSSALHRAYDNKLRADAARSQLLDQASPLDQAALASPVLDLAGLTLLPPTWEDHFQVLSQDEYHSFCRDYY